MNKWTWTIQIKDGKLSLPDKPELKEIPESLFGNIKIDPITEASFADDGFILYIFDTHQTAKAFIYGVALMVDIGVDVGQWWQSRMLSNHPDRDRFPVNDEGYKMVIREFGQ